MPSSTDEENGPLSDNINSILALLEQFITTLNPSTEPSNDSLAPMENAPNPLRVLSDSAKLVKAHTTKLSLLAINKPFTPSAVAKILKEVAGTCLPAMMSAVQICEQRKAEWGGGMGREVRARVRRTMKEMEVLIREILAISEGRAAVGARRDSLSSTGVVWESCDALIELEALGVGGLALLRVREYRDTIKDAIAELKDWAEGEDLETEGRVDGLLDSDDEGVAGDKDSIEDIFNAANSLPSDRPDLKALAEEADGKLKKIVILYNALEKRRLSTYKVKHDLLLAGQPVVARLDDLLLCLRKIPHQVDEMASYLYDLDEGGARTVLEKCVTEARTASKAAQTDWEGNEDAFTAWLTKWEAAVG